MCTGHPEVITTLPPSNKITTLYTFDTEYSADSVEWCPLAPFQNFFVCANYYLSSKDEQKRLGRILLFSIDPENDLTLHQKLDTMGILDQKWCHVNINENILLGVVTAKGSLDIYKLDADALQLQIVYSFTIKTPEGEECLLLSLDWSTGKFGSERPDIICSDSKGKIHKFKLIPNELAHVRSWQGHQYEAWIAGFYYWNPTVSFSGGDDSVFIMYDERIGPDPIVKNKSHKAGVTCLHSNAEKENMLVTGSYDTNLRLWDIRNLKCPQKDLEMPGTLWRVKWEPFNKELILAACMVGGVHIVSTLDYQFKIKESFYEHKSMAYGADWCYLNEDEVLKYKYAGNRIIATCSFYDKLLCVSRVCVCADCDCISGCIHAK